MLVWDEALVLQQRLFEGIRPLVLAHHARPFDLPQLGA